MRDCLVEEVTSVIYSDPLDNNSFGIRYGHYVVRVSILCYYIYRIKYHAGRVRLQRRVSVPILNKILYLSNRCEYEAILNENRIYYHKRRLQNNVLLQFFITSLILTNVFVSYFIIWSVSY